MLFVHDNNLLLLLFFRNFFLLLLFFFFHDNLLLLLLLFFHNYLLLLLLFFFFFFCSVCFFSGGVAFLVVLFPFLCHKLNASVFHIHHGTSIGRVECPHTDMFFQNLESNVLQNVSDITPGKIDGIEVPSIQVTVTTFVMFDAEIVGTHGRSGPMIQEWTHVEEHPTRFEHIVNDEQVFDDTGGGIEKETTHDTIPLMGLTRMTVDA
mmetsp:Transcript_3474/g.7781  ORF Transcript_3474/g.7781 Transcript_3474/m.7781 type:complete len:207 (-) Transcript_3474:428-1048(-)